jgi:sugar phosphate isomerase/epimerase
MAAEWLYRTHRSTLFGREELLEILSKVTPKDLDEIFFEETQFRRLLPGQGSFDLVGLVRTLDEIGSRAPLGVEVLSSELASRRPSARSRARARRRCVRYSTRRVRPPPRDARG